MAQQIKYPPAIQETQETRIWSLGQEDPLEKEMAPHSRLLPGKFHGQRILVGYNPWSHERVGCDWATKRSNNTRDELKVT